MAATHGGGSTEATRERGADGRKRTWRRPRSAAAWVGVGAATAAVVALGTWLVLTVIDVFGAWTLVAAVIALGLWAATSGSLLAWEDDRRSSGPLLPTVEVEEDVYSYTPSQNGSGPMWCHGSTCLVRAGELVVASGVETIPDAKPLNCVRWTLWTRDAAGWKLALRDETGRTREPSPLAVLPGGRVLLSVNPTLEAPDAYSGRAEPRILEFRLGATGAAGAARAAGSTAPGVGAPGVGGPGAGAPAPGVPATRSSGAEALATGTLAAPRVHLPEWEGKPPFTEHSYRSFAADGENGECILFQNIDYTHAEWTFQNLEGEWSAKGRLVWPWAAEYPKPGPVRVCYPVVALENGRVWFCGVSDIVEPYPEWRAFKKKLTGNEWDYDFRRLYFTWSENLATGSFHEWVEVSSADRTCGWIFPCDIRPDKDGSVHLLWLERKLDERLRETFFPAEKQRVALEYAVLVDGKVVLRRPIQEMLEGKPGLTPGNGRFHVSPSGRLFVIYFTSGTDASGAQVRENRLVEVLEDGKLGPEVRVPFASPFTSFFTATPRAGTVPSDVLDLLGEGGPKADTLRYARLRLRPEASVPPGLPVAQPPSNPQPPEPSDR